MAGWKRSSRRRSSAASAPGCVGSARNAACLRKRSPSPATSTAPISAPSRTQRQPGQHPPHCLGITDRGRRAARRLTRRPEFGLLRRLEQTSRDERSSECPSQLRRDEQRHVGRRDAGEAVRQAAGDGDRRIGEAGRRGEPVGGGDVERDAGRAPTRGRWRTVPRIVRIRPKVAIASPVHWPSPVRAFTDSCSVGRSNIRCAAQAPRMPKASWTTI